MILRKLTILNYKNIREATLTLSPKINCFVGSNGVGKTNLLDAVYFLSFCRSATTTVDSQVISHGEPFCMIEGEYVADDAVAAPADGTGDAGLVVACGMKRGQKKHFKRNGKEYRRLSEHIGLIPVVVVSPADASLVDGGSEERRRLMDVVIAQTDRTFMDLLNRYNAALQQRNTMLKQEDPSPDPLLMQLLEEQMAESGE